MFYQNDSTTQAASEAFGGIFKMNGLDALANDLMGANPSLDLDKARKYAGLILGAEAADDFITMQRIIQEALYNRRANDGLQDARFENGRFVIRPKFVSMIC